MGEGGRWPPLLTPMEDKCSMEKRQEAAPKLWSANFTRLVLITLLAFTVRQMAMSSFSLLITWAGGNVALAGGLTMLLTVASLVMRVFSGPLTDKLGRHMVMIIGVIIYLLSVLLIALWPAMGMIAAMQVLFGAGMANLTTASGAAVVDVTPPSRLGEGLGYYTLGNSIAMAIGPSLGLALIGSTENYRAMYLCAAALLAITGILCWQVRYQAPPVQAGKKFSIRDVIEPATIPASLIQFFAIFSFTSVISYIASYAQQQGIGGIGSFFIVYALGMILVRLVVGKVVDRYSEKLVTVIAFLVMAAAFAGVVYAKNLTALMVAAFVLGLGQGAVMPALQKAAMKHVEPQRRGAGNATYQLFADIGTGFGAAVWGVLAEAAGYASIYWGAAILCLLSVVLTFAILERRKTK